MPFSSKVSFFQVMISDLPSGIAAASSLTVVNRSGAPVGEASERRHRQVIDMDDLQPGVAGPRP